MKQITKQKQCKRLERLSDKVRMGISISFREAIEVIQYQDEIRHSHKWWKFWRSK